tara:strand:- start:9586 stop:11229 length:1644 start_codon:yes stop_codon:yes gene_type:complete
MALLKKLRQIDEGAVGSLFSDIADVIIADRKMDQDDTRLDLTSQQVQSSIDTAKQGLQAEASKLSMSTYGTPGMLEVTDDGSYQMPDDLFIEDKNPVTNQPNFDYSKLTKEEKDQLSESMVQSSMPYESMRNPDGTLSPENEANFNIAMTGVQRNFGLSPKKVFNEKKYGGQGLVLDDSGTRILTLQEIQNKSATETSTEAQKEIISTKTESEEKLIKARGREAVSQLELGYKHDFDKIAAQTGAKKEVLEAEYELREELQGNDQDFARELKEIDIEFETWKTTTNNSFAKEIAREKIQSIEMLHSKSFENEKAMAAINNNYSKELQDLGFQNAKDLKEYEFDNSWQVMLFLEKQKMARLEFEDDSRFMMYLTAQKDALAKEGRMEEWWKDQQAIVLNQKLTKQSKDTLTMMPELFMPITNQGHEWESSWFGYNEDDFIAGANKNLVEPLGDGGVAALEDLARNDPENPMIQMVVDNIDHLLKTMGAPPDADGNYGEESQIDGAFFGVAGKIDFYNATLTGVTADRAGILYRSLAMYKKRIKTAQGK